ncbi:hypothetical protein DHD32_06495 [Arenibacter sp. TNZ]|uniref:phospholipase D-like domain-containing protein n=1 Tax=Arenibacter TaxID=178469 RepID=UPI000CD438BC|nr:MULTISPECIES: phospholipase D-like domain-containing protein [Arenibacter]MCM4171121.1 hypothetical protein [Arenibacter sp. TNZ]
MQFLANINKGNNHFIALSEKLKRSDEAYFAVAFLKVSGLSILSNPITKFLKAGGKLTIVVGQNFALTEPKALMEFRNMFKSYPESKIYLAKANSKDSVFHPKLYLFKSKRSCSIISGSANITKGGLVKNKESSISIDCKTKDDIWLDALSYFNYLIGPSNADEADLLVIKQYETFFEQQKQHNKKAKSIPTKTKSQIAFDYVNLAKHFKKFNTLERQKNFKEKQTHYKEAKKVLNQIADNTSLTQKQFEPLLDSLVGSKEVYSLWHSGSLFRLRRKVYPHFRAFQKLLIYIRDNRNQNADIVFDRAKEMVENINGAAVNYVTEIMMTYNSVEFANMNRNPITVLKEEGGVKIKAHSSSYNGADYVEYCELIKEISLKLGLKNMLEADTFFNEIYWKIKY